MLKKTGELINAEIFYRKRFNNYGLKLCFKMDDFPITARTFSIPKNLNNSPTKVTSFINAMGLNLSSSLLNSPTLLNVDFLNQSKDKKYILSISESGKSDYPYNIEGIEQVSI